MCRSEIATIILVTNLLVCHLKSPADTIKETKIPQRIKFNAIGAAAFDIFSLFTRILRYPKDSETGIMKTASNAP